MPTGSPKGQLYDMEADIGETNNLYESKPEIAERLLKQMTADVMRGRSTDGAESSNDVDGIVLWKSEQDSKKPAKKAGKKASKKTKKELAPQ